MCSASLFRLARRTRARAVAVAGFLFACAAVGFAGLDYVWPAAAFFVLTTAAWLAFLRKSPSRVDPVAGDA
jgi:arginine:agmatine antiporter